MSNIALVVAWHNPKQIDEFREAWGLAGMAGAGYQNCIFFQEDKNKDGCAATKNAGIRRAYDAGFEYISVLDDDCYPATPDYTLQNFFDDHLEALEPQKVRMVYATTNPAPRGMPYLNRRLAMPVAASIGLWLRNPDFDAMTALVLGADAEIGMARVPFFRHYFPFCGMNFAFHRQWIECAQLINVPRFDDIWMGWVWEKIAYTTGFCFNLAGPLVNHMRQSDVWANLEQEVKYLQINETLWEQIHKAPPDRTAAQLRKIFGLSVI